MRKASDVGHSRFTSSGISQDIRRTDHHFCHDRFSFQDVRYGHEEFGEAVVNREARNHWVHDDKNGSTLLFELEFKTKGGFRSTLQVPGTNVRRPSIP